MNDPNHTKTTYNTQLQAIKANDEKALQQLYLANYPKVEKFVILNNGSAEEAKDIYQDAFTSMWRNIQLEKFSAQDENSLTGYLFRIAKNKWIDHLRSAAVKKTVKLDLTKENLMTIEETDDNTIKRLALIKTKFTQLGENCKKLLGEFYYKKTSLREIAALMGWTEATARNNKYRCIEKLRELVNSEK